MLRHTMEDSLLLPCWDVVGNVLFESALFNSKAACAQHAVVAQGRFAVGTGTSDGRPLGQGAGILTPGTSCSPWGRRGWHSWRSPDRQGPTKQLVTIINSGIEQWIKLFTWRQSKFSLVSPCYACLLPLFLWRAARRGRDPVSMQDVFIVCRTTLLYSLEAWSGFGCSLFPTNNTFQ